MTRKLKKKKGNRKKRRKKKHITDESRGRFGVFAKLRSLQTCRDTTRDSRGMEICIKVKWCNAGNQKKKEKWIVLDRILKVSYKHQVIWDNVKPV